MAGDNATPGRAHRPVDEPDACPRRSCRLAFAVAFEHRLAHRAQGGSDDDTHPRADREWNAPIDVHVLALRGSGVRRPRQLGGAAAGGRAGRGGGWRRAGAHRSGTRLSRRVGGGRRVRPRHAPAAAVSWRGAPPVGPARPGRDVTPPSGCVRRTARRGPSSGSSSGARGRWPRSAEARARGVAPGPRHSRAGVAEEFPLPDSRRNTYS